ncbi:hypothetical protein DXT99_25950 [Pontibacter diazotrophicus]|uniref:Uncharacterized protein n=1 Tax=Pontibacter diazotrophicus TaxID=1400979 RepID=A0A3D8L062_9BACT|nr:hypothetical protein DXT99_25950 [Pontibacter diazotrophicus]
MKRYGPLDELELPGSLQVHVDGGGPEHLSPDSFQVDAVEMAGDWDTFLDLGETTCNCYVYGTSEKYERRKAG